MALVDRIHDESVSLVPKTPRQALVTYSEDESDTFSSTQPDSNLPVAVVFRDSFGDAMVPFMAEHFSRALYPRYAGGFDYATVEKEKPDLVIFEFVERGLYPWGGMPNPPEVDAEVCAHKFETLTDTRLLIGPGDTAQSLQAFDQTEITPQPDHILLQGPGSGPSILLPAFEYPAKQTLLFAMDITVPADTGMQVYYKTEADQEYSTDRTYFVALKAGRQKIYFELPTRKVAESLRLDIGTEVGDYLLHSLEIRAVPKRYKFPLGWEINGKPASS